MGCSPHSRVGQLKLMSPIERGRFLRFEAPGRDPAAIQRLSQKSIPMNTTTKPLPVPQNKGLPDLRERPNSIHFRETVPVKGFGKLKIRPIQLDDEEEMIRFHQGLSEESIYMRYFEFLGLDQRTSHDRLVRICKNTGESYAIVMEASATPHRLDSILAVGRITTTDKPYVATFDTLIVTEKKTPQLAKVLLKRLVILARSFGFQTLTGELLVADHDTLNLCRALGFTLQTLPEDGLVRTTLELK
jgi:acetyltransferase